MSKKKYRPSIVLDTKQHIPQNPLDPHLDSLPTLPSEIPFEELKFVKKLGTGTQGVVKKVSWGEFFYALKSIPVQDDDQSRKNCVSEYKSLVSCSYPSVLSLYQVYYKDQHIHLLTEYMNLGSLETIMKKVVKFPEGVTAKIAFHVLKGLVHIHQKKLIHRDLKPGNILIHSKGGVTSVKIADFGMSGNAKSVFSTFQGSTMYMSPERLRGETHGFNSDIFSLGLTIAECVLGKYPIQIQDSTIWEMMLQYEKSNINYPEDCSPEFRDFVEQCTNCDPKTRPGALELLDHEFIRKKDNVSIGRWLHEELK